MDLTRRELLAASAGALSTLSYAAADPGRTTLGIVVHSYGIRAGARRDFTEPLTFVDYCHRLGAGGVQLSIGARDKEYTARLRAQVEACKMHLEGSIRLPQDRGDLERFAREVQTAKEAGATVLRTVGLSGRRYETFASAAAYRHFAAQVYESLGWAEPIVARAGARLALENHKDFRVDELLDLLKRLGSRHVGVCVDTGNSIALLEDPLAVVEAYAPFAFSTHLKDMAVQEFEEGFLLAEVPFGAGYLDLPKIVQVLRQAQPDLRFNLEMITRDPLKVPCLTPKFWATLEQLPGRHLAHALRMVRKHASKRPLPQISLLTPEGKLQAEDDNVRHCLKYARDHLAL